MEFTPHHAGKKQGTMHDTVKKKIIHEIRQKCKHGNDLAASLETGNEHADKDALFAHSGFTATGFKDSGNPTEIELTECTECVKEKNERFRAHQDNSEKAFSLMHGFCNKAMQPGIC